MNAILLLVVVFAWGFSWYGIRLQVDEASPLISVTYRFYLSAAVMCVGLWVLGRLKPIPLGDHKLLAALGFCLFSMNFLCFYIAANYLPSGLLSVIFATAAIFGAINLPSVSVWAVRLVTTMYCVYGWPTRTSASAWTVCACAAGENGEA